MFRSNSGYLRTRNEGIPQGLALTSPRENEPWPSSSGQLRTASLAPGQHHRRHSEADTRAASRKNAACRARHTRLGPAATAEARSCRAWRMARRSVVASSARRPERQHRAVPQPRTSRGAVSWAVVARCRTARGSRPASADPTFLVSNARRLGRQHRTAPQPRTSPAVVSRAVVAGCRTARGSRPASADPTFLASSARRPRRQHRTAPQRRASRAAVSRAVVARCRTAR